MFSETELTHLMAVHARKVHIRRWQGEVEFQHDGSLDDTVLASLVAAGHLVHGPLSNVPRRLELAVPDVPGAPPAIKHELLPPPEKIDKSFGGHEKIPYPVNVGGTIVYFPLPAVLIDELAGKELPQPEVASEAAAVPEPETVEMDPSWNQIELHEFAAKVNASLDDWQSDPTELLPDIFDLDYDLTISQLAQLLRQADPDSRPVVLTNASDPFTFGGIRGLRDQEWTKGDGSEIVLVVEPGPARAGELAGLLDAGSTGELDRDPLDLHGARTDHADDRAYCANKGEEFTDPEPWERAESNGDKTVFFVASTDGFQSYFPSAHFFDGGILHVVAMEVD